MRDTWGMNVVTRDGRTLQVVDAGGEGLACVFHSGTPSGAIVDRSAVQAAKESGLRWLTYGRPGYGDSTALPGRDVAQAAADTVAVLDALGLDRFVTYGLSGGGPHALACAALVPDRCGGAASVAGLGPPDMDVDLLDGMAHENVEELTAAGRGRADLEEFLDSAAAGLSDVTAADVMASLGGLVSPPDRAALTGEVAEYLAASFREGLRNGVAGWRDDDLAFLRPWGFDLGAVAVPVAIWQGEQDRMVPVAHGRWLAAHIPGAREHLYPEHGHLSLGVAQLPAILADLTEHALP